MQAPTMIGAHEVAPETFELSSYLPVPGLGVLPVNAFLIRGEQPVLVDTGLAALGEAFLDTLGGVIDPADLRWIWLSHTDADHIGNLAAILEHAPKAEVVTSFLGMGKMMLAGLAVDRVRLIEPEARLAVGDREIVPLKPPYYDAPETTGFFDTRTRALFVADAFGALMAAPATEAADITDASLGEGIATWSAIDAPWLAQADRGCLSRSLAAIEELDPSVVLSGHLPAARGMTGRLVRNVMQTCSGSPTEPPEIRRLIDERPARAA